MNSKRNDRHKGQDGAVLIMAAIAMMAVLTLVAVIVDLGMLMVVRGNLQTALDAAVLAAVQPETGVLQVDTRTRLEASTRREFFAAGQVLPEPAERIRQQEPVYDTRCDDIEVDPATGEPVRVSGTGAVQRRCRQELRGWWVSYVVNYRRVTDAAFTLHRERARQEAEAILMDNAAAWRRAAGIRLTDPDIRDDRLTCAPAGQPNLASAETCPPGFDAYELRYQITEGSLRVQTALAGHLLGQQGWMNLSLAGTEASLTVRRRA